jgi:hypothetical protein
MPICITFTGKALVAAVPIRRHTERIVGHSSTTFADSRDSIFRMPRKPGAIRFHSPRIRKHWAARRTYHPECSFQFVSCVIPYRPITSLGQCLRLLHLSIHYLRLASGNRFRGNLLLSCCLSGLLISRKMMRSVASFASPLLRSPNPGYNPPYARIRGFHGCSNFFEGSH